MYFIYKAPSRAAKACDYRFVATAASFEKAKAKVQEEKTIDKAIRHNAQYPIYYVRDTVCYKEV